MRIDICLTCDENYVEYMGATIVSILKNSGDKRYIFSFNYRRYFAK